MGNFLNQFANGNLHIKLLAQFANETLFKCFMGFAFATGKFPESTQMR